MATNTWTGAIDNDYNNAGNWSLGSVPVNGQDIVIDDAKNNIELTLNQSAVTPNSVTVTSKFRKNIGTGSDSLQYGAITVGIDFAGRGEFAKFNCTTVPKARIHQDANTSFLMAGGTWQDVENSGVGYTEVAAGAVVGSGGNAVWRNIGGRVRMYANATKVGTLHLEGGTVTSDRNIGTPNVFGAGSQLVLTNTAGVIDGGSVGRGGVISYRGSGGLSPTAAIEVKPGGLITPALNPNSALGSSAPAGAAFGVKANVWQGGNVIKRAGSFKFNEANLVDIGQAGGSVSIGSPGASNTLAAGGLASSS